MYKNKYKKYSCIDPGPNYVDVLSECISVCRCECTFVQVSVIIYFQV